MSSTEQPPTTVATPTAVVTTATKKRPYTEDAIEFVKRSFSSDKSKQKEREEKFVELFDDEKLPIEVVDLESEVLLQFLRLRLVKVAVDETGFAQSRKEDRTNWKTPDVPVFYIVMENPQSKARISLVGIYQGNVDWKHKRYCVEWTLDESPQKLLFQDFRTNGGDSSMTVDGMSNIPYPPVNSYDIVKRFCRVADLHEDEHLKYFAQQASVINKCWLRRALMISKKGYPFVASTETASRLRSAITSAMKD